ncbi:site-specific integrase, partial [Bacteroidota bacterium]
MHWQQAIQGFKTYLQLERSLSGNTIESYLRDVNQLKSYSKSTLGIEDPTLLDTNALRTFVQNVANLGLSATTQSRIISGVRSFYKYLLLEDS